MNMQGRGFQVEGRVEVEVLCHVLFKEQQEGRCGWSRDRENRGDEVRSSGPGGPCRPLEGLQHLL